MPPLVTGFLLALMTQRTFFVDFPFFDSFYQPDLDFSWARYSGVLQSQRPNLTSMEVAGDATAAQYDLWLNGDLNQNFSNHDIVYYGPVSETVVPVLVANQRYSGFFSKYFPTREVFYPLSQFILRVTEQIQKKVDAFRSSTFGKFTIGLQIRTHKCGDHGLLQCAHLPPVASYCSVARAIQFAAGISEADVRFFVATDSEAVHAQVSGILGAERVIFTTYNMSEITAAGNPGNEESSVVDLTLLSLCDDLVLTSASSFGWTAAALQNIRPVYMTFGDPGRHAHLQSPHFWRALSSDICFWRFHHFKMVASAGDVQKFMASPYALQHEQCHF